MRVFVRSTGMIDCPFYWLMAAIGDRRWAFPPK
jgi:hypothetical protein